MKAKEYSQKTTKELVDELRNQRRAQLNLRFQKAQGSVQKPSEIKKVRRSIARIKTIIARGSK